jgi:hypothetical protein
MVQRARNAAGKRGPWTVADAMNAYLDFLEGDARSAHSAMSDVATSPTSGPSSAITRLSR